MWKLEKIAYYWQVGIAGSTKIGDSCVLAGQTGITGHVNITDQVWYLEENRR